VATTSLALVVLARRFVFMKYVLEGIAPGLLAACQWSAEPITINAVLASVSQMLLALQAVAMQKHVVSE
jgi:hypothetical protein